MSCPHHTDGTCTIAEQLAAEVVQVSCPVTPAACRRCSELNGESRRPNRVTASLAVSAVRRSYPERAKDILQHTRHLLAHYPRGEGRSGVGHTHLGASLRSILHRLGAAEYVRDCDAAELDRSHVDAERLARRLRLGARQRQLRVPGGTLARIASVTWRHARRRRVRALILDAQLSPGDILTLTAAIESLHTTYPGEYVTDVRTSCPAIWEHNPHITHLDDADGVRLQMAYPSVHRSNQQSIAFLAGYTTHLGQLIGRPLALRTNRPHLYLSDEERGWQDQVRQHVAGGRQTPFWLVCAGVKSDYTAKQWPIEHYEDVIDRTRGRIQWVQVGAANHDHPPLQGAIDLRGQTTHRQLIRLAYHCRGGLGPVTYLQHLCAAWQKPYICLLGGREPATWVQYPLQHTLHTLGSLDCCRTKACWKSRVVPLGDGDAKDKSLCEQPVYGLQRAAARCMALIRPDDVLSVLERVAWQTS